MLTIEVPNFWVFRMPCGCTYGSVVGATRDQSFVCATEDQAWREMYSTQRERDRMRKSGRRCTAEDVLPPLEEWSSKTFVDGVCTIHTTLPGIGFPPP